MQFWVGLVAGLIIGWVVEWIIDWYFWRQESLQALFSDDQARQQLDAARLEIEELRAQLAATESSAPTTSASDVLSRISGIGKVYEKRLNEAGIYTFAEIAQTSSARLQEIIKPAEWQAVDFENWIDQASALAQESLTAAKGA